MMLMVVMMMNLSIHVGASAKSITTDLMPFHFSFQLTYVIGSLCLSC